MWFCVWCVWLYTLSVCLLFFMACAICCECECVYLRENMIDCVCVYIICRWGGRSIGSIVALLILASLHVCVISHWHSPLFSLSLTHSLSPSSLLLLGCYRYSIISIIVFKLKFLFDLLWICFCFKNGSSSLFFIIIKQWLNSCHISCLPMLAMLLTQL